MTQATLYRIRKWDDTYENNRTRELREMRWVPVPNKWDGDGFTALMDRDPWKAAAYLGGFLLLLQVASKCSPRGTLLRRNGTPHCPASLSRLTRAPAELFAELMPILADDEIGWLEVIDLNTKTPTTEPPVEPEQRSGAMPLADSTYEKHNPLRILHDCEAMRGITLEQYLMAVRAHSRHVKLAEVATVCTRLAALDGYVAKPGRFWNACLDRWEKDNKEYLLRMTKQDDETEQRIEELAQFIREGGTGLASVERQKREHAKMYGQAMVDEAVRRV